MANDDSAFFSHLLGKYGHVDEYESNIFSTMAYAKPFRHLSAHFVKNLSIKYGHYVEPCSRITCFNSLVDWYLSRLINTARFAFHTDYISLGMNYPAWCDGFKPTLSKNHTWRRIANEYPVLINWLAKINQFALASTKELFYRLESDREDIKTTFGIPSTAKLIDIETGLSDPHQQGRVVIRLVFEGKQSLIYKPKPLMIEAAFNDLAREHGKTLGLHAILILPRNDYGYAEDIGASGVIEHESNEAVGRATACFWLLNATDLHFENIRKIGQAVIALDLETLLAPAIIKYEDDQSYSWRAHTINSTLLFDSNLVPNNLESNISGFDAPQEIKSKKPRIRFEIIDDKVHFIVDPVDEKSEHLANASLDSSGQKRLNEIVQGFQKALDEGANSIIAQFVQRLSGRTTLRLVPRPTELYAQILDRMRQPCFLRDPEILQKDLENLHNSISDQIPNIKRFHELVDDEIRQLLDGDIPYFSFKVDSKDLKTSKGYISKYFVETGRERCFTKATGIELSDQKEQKAILTIALGGNPVSSEIKDINETRLETSETMLSILGRRLMDEAFLPINRPARWLALLGDVADGVPKVDSGQVNCFGGSYGNLTALEAIRASINPKNTMMADLEVFLDREATIMKHLMLSKDVKAIDSNLGIFGYAGELFAYTSFITLNPARWGFLDSYFAQILISAERQIKFDSHLDVIGGVSGLILAIGEMLKLGVSRTNHDIAERVLRNAAIHLVNKAHESELGTAWIVPGETKPLLSYAHGWAGIVSALDTATRYIQVENDRRRVAECLEKTSSYPNKILATHGDWFDLRDGLKEKMLLNKSWCNGESGILRGLYVARDHWDQNVNDKIDRISEELVTSTQGKSSSFRFCCGEMGVADFLYDYGRQFQSRDSILTAKQRAVKCAQEFISLNLSDIQKTPEKIFPGLYQGYSGIAYTLARISGSQLSSLSLHRF